MTEMRCWGCEHMSLLLFFPGTAAAEVPMVPHIIQWQLWIQMKYCCSTTQQLLNIDWLDVATLIDDVRHERQRTDAYKLLSKERPPLWILMVVASKQAELWNRTKLQPCSANVDLCL